MYELSHQPWGGGIVFWMGQISRNDISEDTHFYEIVIKSRTILKKML